MKRYLPPFLLALYLVPRFFFASWFEGLPSKIGYALEFSYCSVVALLFWSDYRFRFKSDSRFYRALALNLICGFAVFAGASAFKIAVPWSFNTFSMFFLLVIWAPLLEEFIFRQSLWVLIEKIPARLRPSVLALVATTLLFSLGHFIALFKVDTSLRTFVIYQAFYTLVAGFFWGRARLATQSVFAPILFHALFNFGFFLGERILPKEMKSPSATSTAENANPPAPAEEPELMFPIPADLPKGGLLIVDMPIDSALVPTGLPLKLLGGHGESPKLDPKKCRDDMEMLENFFESQLGKKPFGYAGVPHIEDRLRRALIASHGLHTAGLLAKTVHKLPLYHFSLSPPPHPKTGIANVTRYKERDIRVEMSNLSSVISQIQPQIVLAASGDTFDENFSDLKNGGYDENTSLGLAKDIIEEWKKAWSKILSLHSKTWFVVPAGNGSLDWRGDLLLNPESGNATVPAILDFPNLIRVASYIPSRVETTECLSTFSNYGEAFVDAAAPGELISSGSACAARPQVKLTGTAQSAALLAAYLAIFIEQNQSVATALGQLKNSLCLKGRIRYGYL